MILVFLALIILIPSPAFAYRSGNQIIVKKRNPANSKSLFKRKFVFMQEQQQSSFQEEASPAAPSYQDTRQAYKSDASGVGAAVAPVKRTSSAPAQVVSAPVRKPRGVRKIAAPPVRVRAKGPESRGIVNTNIASNPELPDEDIDIYDEGNWGDFAEDYNLGVRAHIRD